MSIDMRIFRLRINSKFSFVNILSFHLLLLNKSNKKNQFYEYSNFLTASKVISISFSLMASLIK
jgi:hypothetical protein